MTNIRTLMADNVNGATFIGLDTETAVKLAGGKSNPLQGRVTKRTIGSSVMVFQNKHSSSYGDMVQRRLQKEGKDPKSFEVGPRSWGTRIPNTPFIEHKGQHYLEVIFLKGGSSAYFVDGNETPQSAIEGIPTSRPSPQGGLDDKVIIRAFKIDSITKLTIGKQSHTNLSYA